MKRKCMWFFVDMFAFLKHSSLREMECLYFCRGL